MIPQKHCSRMLKINFLFSTTTKIIVAFYLDIEPVVFGQSYKHISPDQGSTVLLHQLILRWAIQSRVRCNHFLERRRKARFRKERLFEVGALKSVISNRLDVMITDTGGIIRLAFKSRVISCPRLDPKWVDTQRTPLHPPTPHTHTPSSLRGCIRVSWEACNQLVRRAGWGAACGVGLCINHMLFMCYQTTHAMMDPPAEDPLVFIMLSWGQYYWSHYFSIFKMITISMLWPLRKNIYTYKHLFCRRQ